DQRRLVRPAGIRASQPDATPQVAMPLGGQRFDCLRDPSRVRTLHEPQASAKPLVKDMAGEAAQRPGRCTCDEVAGPGEVALVETVAVDDQPTKQRIQPSQSWLDWPTQSSQGPAC